MRYGEGYRALNNSEEGRTFIDSMTNIDFGFIKEGHLNVGDIVFNATSKKTTQKFYLITDMNLRDGNKRYHLQLRRLTPTGRKAKQIRGTNIRRDFSTSLYLVTDSYEQARHLYEEYRKATKNDVISGEKRDNQKTKVYKSEWQLPEEIKALQVGETQRTIQKYINTVVDNPKIRKAFSHLKRVDYISFKLNNRRTGGMAFRDGVIECANSTFGKSKITILHEVAHFYTPDTGHGKQFTSALLKILEIEFPEAYIELKKNYDKFGVNYEI